VTGPELRQLREDLGEAIGRLSRRYSEALRSVRRPVKSGKILIAGAVEVIDRGQPNGTNSSIDIRSNQEAWGPQQSYCCQATATTAPKRASRLALMADASG
jgi:hypothetical protein